MKVGILNVTGYAGMELARILQHHPEATIASVTGRSTAGKRLDDVFPHLSGLDLTITEDLTGSVDLVISALPHGASAERLAGVLREGVKAVDVSADFRLADPAEYREWYEIDHPCPEYLEDAVYGLPELHRDEVAAADLVANPGCYPTASILALAPAIAEGIIEPDIIVDAKSGVSGAGRGKHYYSEVNESVMAYSLGGHRHQPEIAQELTRLDGARPPRLTFTPHLVPMTRGILATCYAPLREGALEPGGAPNDRVHELYADYYHGKPFVRVAHAPPATKHTLGGNTCVVFPTVDARSNRLIVVSCLDNLVKGAAGQAVQNMNLMFGLREEEGLQQLALYP